MKPGTVFYKMSGSGNDFIMVDGRYVHLDSVDGLGKFIEFEKLLADDSERDAGR